MRQTRYNLHRGGGDQTATLLKSESKKEQTHAKTYEQVCTCHGAHGVAVSHPLSMREALGPIPSVSICIFHTHDGMLRQTELELEDVSVLVTSNYETIFKQMQSKLCPVVKLNGIHKTFTWKIRPAGIKPVTI